MDAIISPLGMVRHTVVISFLAGLRSSGMGATPLMELFIANRHLHKVLLEKGIGVYRTMVGNYMTALEMEGFSISLLKLDDELKALLDAPCDTPALVQA